MYFLFLKFPMTKSLQLRPRHLLFGNWSLVLFGSSFFLLCITPQVHAQQSNPSFIRSDSVAAAYKGASLQNLPVLAHKLTHSLPTDVEKFRAIFKWVAENITNDYQLFTRNQKMRAKLKDPAERKAWNDKMQPQVFQRLRERKSTICTGYAYLIKELCAFAGITAEIVDGYGRTINANIGGDGIVNHSWNVVRLNNRWYLCDATWASGVIDATHHQFIPKYEDVYFLSPPDYFIRNHLPLDSKWMLTDMRVDLRTFLNRPIIYPAAYKHKILPIAPDTFTITLHDQTLSITLESETSAPPALRLIVNTHLPVSVALTPDANGHLTAQHRLPGKGRYTVHGLIDQDVVFTYSVTVEN
jgi:hypothetical protein